MDGTVSLLATPVVMTILLMYYISMLFNLIRLSPRLADPVKNDRIGYNVGLIPTNWASLQLVKLFSSGQHFLEELNQAIIVCQVVEFMCEVSIHLALAQH